MDTPDRARLQAIAQWIQREDEALLYTPDGGDVALGRGIGCYLLEGRIPVPACNSQSQTFEPVFAARPEPAPLNGRRAACPAASRASRTGERLGGGFRWRGVGAKMGARRRWKRPFDFPILFAPRSRSRRQCSQSVKPCAGCIWRRNSSPGTHQMPSMRKRSVPRYNRIGSHSGVIADKAL